MASAPSEPMQLLTFVLADVELALKLLEVTQIVEYAEPTRVPHLPEVIRGVINLRGSVVPVVDLRLKLGLAARPVTRRTCIVVVETREAGTLGIVADSVRQVADIAPEELLPVPDFGIPVRAEYLLGICKPGERMVLVIDAPKALSPAELLAAAEAAA